MRVLSSAFYRLKTIIPWVPHDTKLSKLDTLRLARNYISYLTATLNGQPVNEITNKLPHPQKMVRLVGISLFGFSVNKKNVNSEILDARKIIFNDQSGERIQVLLVSLRNDLTTLHFPSSCHSRGGSWKRNILNNDFQLFLSMKKSVLRFLFNDFIKLWKSLLDAHVWHFINPDADTFCATLRSFTLFTRNALFCYNVYSW